MSISINTELANQQVDAIGTDLNSGFIDIYEGSIPDPDDPPSGTLLVSLALDADAYDAASGGSAGIPTSVSGVVVADGNAQYAQQRNAANTKWMYGTVTATGGGGDVELSDVSLEIDQVVIINTSTITQPLS